MKTIILKSKPGSLFRLGDGSLNDVSDIIHSDTLFSAIANIYELAYNKGEEFIRFVNEGKINFSSAFPLLEDTIQNKIIYFLPKPNFQIKIKNLEGKKEKKIKFVSLNTFKLIVENLDRNKLEVEIDSVSLEIIDDKYCTLKDELNISSIPEELRAFIKEIISPKTAVHKETQEDSFYFQTDLQLIPISEIEKGIQYLPHFYFFLEHTLSQDEFRQFTSCLRILADEGIGGDRSAGKGKFEDVIIREIDFDIENTNGLFVNLAMFNPKDQSEFENCLAYDIKKRGGGDLGSDGNEDYHRKQVRMITEGSLVKGKVEGRVLDVSPFVNFYQHKIYRNGKSFLLPMGKL